MKLSGINKASRTGITVEWQGEQVQVWYDTSRYTTDFEDAVKGLQEEDVRSAEQWATVLSLVVDWDVTDEAENHLPVTVETIATLPVPFLMAVSKAVLGDLSPNAQRATGSPRGSFARR